jgi:hypothetical protein
MLNILGNCGTDSWAFEGKHLATTVKSLGAVNGKYILDQPNQP